MKSQPSINCAPAPAPAAGRSLSGVRRKISRLAKAAAALCAAVCASHAVHAQSSSNVFLPVYHIVQTGATAAQATTLAQSLGLDPDLLTVSNGVIQYVDPDNYLNIPTLPVTDPTAISNLLGQTVNQAPSIPINFEQLDLQSLSDRGALDPASAVNYLFPAFMAAGLTAQFGVPEVSNTRLTTFTTDASGGVTSNSLPLDTVVSFDFEDTNGYPFIGPGAQAQFSFDGTAGFVSRIVFSANQYISTNSVAALTPQQAASRVTGLFPTGADITYTIVYYVPIRWPWPPECPQCQNALFNIENVLPYYEFQSVSQIVNPLTGETNEVQSLPVLVPATDDPAFVPSVNLQTFSATNGPGVNASVNVTGGTPPYYYSWSGSTSATPVTNSPIFNYTPSVRVIQPQLQITPSAQSNLTVSWPVNFNEPAPHPWILEFTTNRLNSAVWLPVPFPVGTNAASGIASATVPQLWNSAFFRLRMVSNTIPTTETVAVTVTDANGVSVLARQNLNVLATPILVVPRALSSGPEWGTESPVDPGLGALDTTDWRGHMQADKAGSESFLWTLDSAWMGDFINPAVRHTLGPDPETSGDDDYYNWGVDAADIVLYIGHGAPPAITFTATSPLFFNNSSLSHAWGATPDPGFNSLEWLCLLSCEVLSNNYSGLTAVQRWGGAFDGLHVLTGFTTLAYAGTGFPATFADNMLVGGSPQTIVKSWFNSASAHGTGLTAAMGPIGPGGVTDYNDHYWGKGPVGPTIKAPQIQGWWYVSQ